MALQPFTPVRYLSLVMGLGIGVLVNVTVGLWSHVSALPLSPGDRLEISIPNERYFAGVYNVNQNGDLEIPYLGPFPVAGQDVATVEAQLRQTLIDKGYFPPNKLQLSVQILQWAPVPITVSGAVFQPGNHFLGRPNEPEKNSLIPPDAQSVTGDNLDWRTVTTGLQAAGGVLPTADVHNVTLIRNGQEQIIDVSGAFTGEPIQDLPLVAGDRLVVPDTGQVQPAIVRPSSITPPGIKVFISNLTIPANSNATSAVGNQQEGITFPYGARFSQAVVAANCVGGTINVNADRHAILVRVDQLTGETTVVDRKIEELVRESSNAEENPFLMPRDAVACYDSSMTNTRDIFRAISDFLSPLNPFLIFRDLFFP